MLWEENADPMMSWVTFGEQLRWFKQWTTIAWLLLAFLVGIFCSGAEKQGVWSMWTWFFGGWSWFWYGVWNLIWS